MWKTAVRVSILPGIWHPQTATARSVSGPGLAIMRDLFDSLEFGDNVAIARFS